MMLLKFNKLCQTNLLKRPDNQKTLSLLMMNTKNTAFTTSNQLPLLSHSPEFTDSTKPLHLDMSQKMKKSTSLDNENFTRKNDLK